MVCVFIFSDSKTPSADDITPLEGSGESYRGSEVYTMDGSGFNDGEGV